MERRVNLGRARVRNLGIDIQIRTWLTSDALSSRGAVLYEGQAVSCSDLNDEATPPRSTWIRHGMILNYLPVRTTAD